jgi:hypothetical protein
VVDYSAFSVVLKFFSVTQLSCVSERMRRFDF